MKDKSVVKIAVDKFEKVGASDGRRALVKLRVIDLPSARLILIFVILCSFAAPQIRTACVFILRICDKCFCLLNYSTQSTEWDFSTTDLTYSIIGICTS